MSEWTSETPKEPGYYWLYVPGKRIGLPRRAVSPVELCRDGTFDLIGTDDFKDALYFGEGCLWCRAEPPALPEGGVQ